MTLPAHYSGVRFMSRERADGRSIDYPAVRGDIPKTPQETKEVKPIDEESTTAQRTNNSGGSFIDQLSCIFGNIGEDDILLAALIMILAGERREGNREAILLLLLLLCIR